MSKYQYEQLMFPGKTLSPDALNLLVLELREVAASCFNKVPSYQALSGKQAELDKLPNEAIAKKIEES